MVLPDGPHAGRTTQVPLLPLRLDGERLGVTADPPRFAQDTRAVLAALDYSDVELKMLEQVGAAAFELP